MVEQGARLGGMQTETTLAHLVEGLGYEVVRVEVAPQGLDVPVADPVIHDRLTGTGFAAADVVLAVGVDGRTPELLDLIASAGLARAAAVIVKLDDGLDLDALVSAAKVAQVALLRVPRNLEWGQLHALVRMVSTTPLVRGDGSAPLGDLSALANAVALRANGPVTIEDPQSRVLAYSTGDQEIDEYRRDTILGRRVPDGWVKRLQHDGAFQRIWRGDGPVLISYRDTEPDYRDRLVMAVRAGDEVIGSIWVQEGSEPLGPEHHRLLIEVAPLAALHLVRHFAGDVERRQEAELVKAVLSGRVPPSSLVPLLALQPSQRITLLGLRPECDDEAEAAMHLGRLGSVVSLFRRTERLQLVQTVSSHTLHVVLVGGSRVDGVAAELVHRARSSVRVPVRAALAHSASGLDTLVDARVDVDDVLDACGVLDGRITELDDVAALVLLARWRRTVAVHPELRFRRIESLVASDSGRGSEYLPTLRAYLDHFGDVISAANSLGVHPNTFRYRLRRAEETVGVDLRDPVERLMTHLQLRLLEAGGDT